MTETNSDHAYDPAGCPACAAHGARYGHPDLVANLVSESDALAQAQHATSAEAHPGDRLAAQRADQTARNSSVRTMYGKSREKTNVYGGDGGVAEFDYVGCVGCITEAHHGVVNHKHHHPFEHNREMGQDAGVVSAAMFRSRPRESFALVSPDWAPGQPADPVTSTRVRPSDYDNED